MKFYFVVFFLAISVFTFAKDGEKTLYDYTAKTIDGKDFDFSSLKGKKYLL